MIFGPKLDTIMDLEVYKDYFLASFRLLATGTVSSFEMYPGQKFNTNYVAAVLKANRIITFNGNHFDIPLIALALTGADNARLKEACDAIIGSNLQPWQFEKRFNVKIPPSIDTIDLIDVAPGIASLKVYGGRLHAAKIQDLPIHQSASIPAYERANIRTYCENDLLTTELLYNHLRPQIDLRTRMSERYDVDLRSKSDAQIAEAVIVKEVSARLGRDIERPQVPSGTVFHYQRPEFIEFRTPAMREILSLIERVAFVVSEKGGIGMPEELADLTIKLGAGEYRMGIGGLHSTEKTVAHLADAEMMIIDRDVASYYPAIIQRCGLAPEHMGSAFTEVYQGILDERLAAKKAGDKVTADALKITVNGSFGKFGSKWSKLYSPDLLIQTTVTGQLALLMLIEALEGLGVQVVSANTDGVVMLCRRADEHLMVLAVEDWEARTGFVTEATEYAAIYSRDVNNYIAIKKDGLAKMKGAYAPVTLQKNPTNEIVTDAVVKLLKDGTPVEYTINHCNDIRKFVSVQKVTGGAEKDGVYLGKAVRWYYSILADGPITKKLNGYTVPKSEGAQPLMDLPDSFPCDVDLNWYIAEAHSILAEIGAQAA